MTRSGATLSYQGRTFTFVGFNIPTANGRATCSLKVAPMTIDASLDAIGSSQQVFRTWFFQPLATRNGQIDWTAFDHTVAVAASHGQKIVAVLGNQWSTCDSGTYRNEAWYRSGYATAPDSQWGPLSYRDWVAAVVGRYRSEPAILAWQLMNEAEDATTTRHSTCSPSAAATLKAWTRIMAGLVKSIDPNHLLSIGTTGTAECGAHGDDYRLLYGDPNVDLCDYHAYGQAQTPLPGDQWNGLAVRIRQCRQLGKPLMVDELGIKLQGEANGSPTSRASWMATKLQAVFEAGVVGTLVWQWASPRRTDYDCGPGDPMLRVLAAARPLPASLAPAAPPQPTGAPVPTGAVVALAVSVSPDGSVSARPPRPWSPSHRTLVQATRTGSNPR